MDEDLIRQLIEETEALPTQELPGAWSWAVNHPGVLSYRTKDPARYDQDMRRAHFLEQMDKRAPASRTREMLQAGQSDSLRALRSPYEPYGADGPLSNFGRLYDSLPGAVYATGKMLANKMDPEVTPYPEAYDDYAKNINNLVVFAEPMGKNKNHMRDMQDMRDAQARLKWHAGLVPGEMPREYADALIAEEAAQHASPKGGREFLEDAGLSGNTARVGGSLMDAVVDPLFIPGKTWLGLGADLGLGSIHGTGPAAIDAIRRLIEPRPAYGAR